jgi:hypothetical protein
MCCRGVVEVLQRCRGRFQLLEFVAGIEQSHRGAAQVVQRCFRGVAAAVSRALELRVAAAAAP